MKRAITIIYQFTFSSERCHPHQNHGGKNCCHYQLSAAEWEQFVLDRQKYNFSHNGGVWVNMVGLSFLPLLHYVFKQMSVSVLMLAMLSQLPSHVNRLEWNNIVCQKHVCTVYVPGYLEKPYWWYTRVLTKQSFKNCFQWIWIRMLCRQATYFLIQITWKLTLTT